MNKLTTIKNVVTSKAGRGLLQIRKVSPEILLVAGVAGVITSTVLACRATLKVEEIVGDALIDINKIEQVAAENNETKYSKKDAAKDLFIVRVQTGAKIAKLYGPSIAVGVVSLACLLGSHNILQKRNVALMSAYKALETGFNEYRKRVVDELGVDKDTEYRYGISKVKVTTIDENGVETSKMVNNINMTDSIYAREFSEKTAKEWSPNPEYNLMTLKCRQNYANDLLNARGHLFLNEVYDMLGIKRSDAGAVVGWVKDNVDGDGFVDFGIYKDLNCQEYVNEYGTSWLLDFNVDGVIFDLI
jgi:hypothetical protein